MLRMSKFIKRLRLLKLDYLIWKCERSHRKWIKAENEIRGNEDGQ